MTLRKIGRIVFSAALEETLMQQGVIAASCQQQQIVIWFYKSSKTNVHVFVEQINKHCRDTHVGLKRGGWSWKCCLQYT